MKKYLLSLLLALSILLCGCKTTAASCPAHADADENGSCDLCGVSVMTTFDFYAINDLHGKIVDGENHIGVDELTTFLDNARRTDDNVVLLSTGDMWQGSSESNLTGGNLVTDWMNDAGFAAMAIGNHEFDWGTDAIEENAELADFPFLAINIYDRDTELPVTYCQSSVVVEADGIQIGIIGAIGDCYSSISADKVQGVYFKTGRELTELVKAESQRLRGEGADLIVYILHDGYGSSGSTTAGAGQMASYYDTSLSDGYVDLVFEGHTHQQYRMLDVNGVYHLQNRGDNKGGISHAEVEINTVTGSFRITQADLISPDSYASLPDDDIVQQLLDKYADQIDIGNKVIGINGARRSSDYLRQLVADLYYELGEETWGDEYDIVLGGGFLSVRSPYELKKGEVTYSQLQSIFPFDNDLVLCSVKGRDLLSKFIHTSNDNYYICCDETLSVLDVEEDGTYYVVVDTYTSSYAPNRLTVVEEYEKGIYARDLLADYIAAGNLEN